MVLSIRKTIEEYSDKNSYEYFNGNVEKYVLANKVRYDDISSEAMNYIVGASKGYDTTSMFVSFSGGKDSTVTSHLVTTALSNPSIIHIFGNTTIELPDTIEYVSRFKKHNRRTPLLTSVNDQQDFFELCKEFGPPSRMLRWCCPNNSRWSQFLTSVYFPDLDKKFNDILEPVFIRNVCGFSSIILLQTRQKSAGGLSPGKNF